MVCDPDTTQRLLKADLWCWMCLFICLLCSACSLSFTAGSASSIIPKSIQSQNSRSSRPRWGARGLTRPKEPFSSDALHTYCSHYRSALRGVHLQPRPAHSPPSLSASAFGFPAGAAESGLAHIAPTWLMTARMPQHEAWSLPHTGPDYNFMRSYAAHEQPCICRFRNMWHIFFSLSWGSATGNLTHETEGLSFMKTYFFSSNESLKIIF